MSEAQTVTKVGSDASEYLRYLMPWFYARLLI